MSGGNAREVLVVGEALVDLIHRPEGSVVERPGGSPANVALGLGRLGHGVELLTDLGTDDRGRLVADWLHESDVVIHRAAGARTSTARARLAADGSAQYEFELRWDPPEPVAVEEFGIVHTGSLAATVEPGAARVAALLDRVRATAITTYDPNIRPAVMTDRPATLARVERLVVAADVVKVSDEDLDWLYPGSSAESCARAWLECGPALIVVTRGGDGAVAYPSAGVEVAVPAAPVEVVDTVGAGDTVMAALVDGLIRAGFTGADARPRLRSVGVDVVRSILERAAAAAGFNVARAGAHPPTAAELDLLLA